MTAVRDTSKTGPTEPLKVVIVGGGTAGWMAAGALAWVLPEAASVRLVESQEIGIIGVGEATLPHLRAFFETLGMDEADVMRATHATFKLGIDFRDFGKIGDSYIHPFGKFGLDLKDVPFHHHWLRMRSLGRNDELSDYSMAIAIARRNRFAPPSKDAASIASTYGYAYQFDATLFAPYMRAYSEARGVTRIEGKVVDVELHGDTGAVAAIVLAGGERIEGDLFIDCTGFRGLLIGDAMKEPWDDWSQWLPCDRAVALPCSSPPGPIETYTRATAMAAGWRWRIPLQHRVGNGYVYSSAHISDEAATDAIVAAVEGSPMAEPRVLKFKAGRRRRGWVKNVVSIGLSAGFLEPLESTSIHLAQNAVTYLVELFPERRVADADRDEFNRLMDVEYDRVRDFLILHYHSTTRDDSDFWNHVRTMDVPDSLEEKIELFAQTGRVAHYINGPFLEPSWIAVFLGQGVYPKRWDPRANAFDPRQVAASMDRLRAGIAATAEQMPDHSSFILQRNANILPAQ
jgi:tryptophan halogenase